MPRLSACCSTFRAARTAAHGEDAFCEGGAGPPRDNVTAVWSQQVCSDLESSIAISPDESTVFVGSGDHHLYALDSRTGNTMWKYTTGDQYFGVARSSPVASADGRVVYCASLVGGDDGNLVAIDAASGQPIWTFSAPGTSMGEILAPPPAVSSDGDTPFMGSQDHRFYAVDSRTGRGIRSFEAGTYSTAALDPQRKMIFAGNKDGNLYAFRFTGGGPPPAPPSGHNECNSTVGCNVCAACCHSYIRDGAPCDECVKQQCHAPPAPPPPPSPSLLSACDATCPAGVIGPILTPAQCAAQAGYQLPANCCCGAAATPPIDTPAHSAMRQRQHWLDGGSAEGARSFAAMADAKPVWTFEGGAPIPLSPAINVPGSLVFA
eukprot:COSAG01_NODE_14582_length_1435_cov_33.800898_1_plen_376_part_01